MNAFEILEETNNIYIKYHTEQLKRLLIAEKFKYSDGLPGKYRNELSNSVGVYHFFKDEGNDPITSLYIGESESLRKRLLQHFQPSHEHALISNIASKEDKDRDAVKQCLCDQEVYFQWLILEETDLIWTECFCKAILKPKYTKA